MTNEVAYDEREVEIKGDYNLPDEDQAQLDDLIK